MLSLLCLQQNSSDEVRSELTLMIRWSEMFGKFFYSFYYYWSYLWGLNHFIMMFSSSFWGRRSWSWQKSSRWRQELVVMEIQMKMMMEEQELLCFLSSQICCQPKTKEETAENFGSHANQPPELASAAAQRVPPPPPSSSLTSPYHKVFNHLHWLTPELQLFWE